jgi:hypothetical protein
MTGKMTDEAKEAMVFGAKAHRAVDAYLQYVDQHKLRGRSVNRETLEAKAKAETNLARKVIIIAQIHEAIRREDMRQEEEALEADFIKYAPRFSEQHGIQYAVWREMGVQTQVLAKAGITS